MPSPARPEPESPDPNAELNKSLVISALTTLKNVREAGYGSRLRTMLAKLQNGSARVTSYPAVSENLPRIAPVEPL